MTRAGRDRSAQYEFRGRTAFTLVELVMVVTIIGIIAAIAVPRMSDATKRASGSALRATLTNVRKTIDCYYAEHGSYPGYIPGNSTPDENYFVNQLVAYTDLKGETSATYGYPYIYGPYLRAPFPTNPTNDLNTVHVKALPTDANPADGTVGWVAVQSTGAFGISATDSDLDIIDILDPARKSRVRGMN
jgi:general secretion pathway protein G